MESFRERIARMIIPILLLGLQVVFTGPRVSAEDEFPSDIFTLEDDSSTSTDPDPWNEGIYASHYGSIAGRKYYGCIGNKLHPNKEYFVALPATEDSLDCINGSLQVRLDDENGLFRIIEIKPSGEDGPVFEATVEDVGPWYCGNDPYWETGTRPESEDGVDGKGRHTNLAGIDLSYALAQDMGIEGIGLVDWRFKKVDGCYVTLTKPTEFRKK